MAKEYQINALDNPEESAWGIIGGGVHEYNIAKAGDNNFQRLCFVLQDSGGEIAGGVLAECYWGWLYIDLIWVEEGLRGQGYGRQLLSRVEQEGRRVGARQVYLDTFSFQAPEFYQKLGYEVFGELENFPAGHVRYFLKKGL